MKLHKIRKYLAQKLLNASYQLRSWAVTSQSWSRKICPSELWYVLIISIALISLPAPAWADSISVSVVDAQGNTETQTVSADAEFTIESDDKSTAQEIKAGLLYGEIDGKRSAEYYHGSIKDRHNAGFINWAQPYWFTLSGFEADEFAGYDLRLSFNMGLGLELKSPRHEFKVEAGPGLIYERRQDPDDPGASIDKGYISARAFEEYTWHITDRIKFSQNAEYLYDYEDARNYRVNAEAGLTGKITDIISFKLGPKARYVNQPVEGKERTDIITAATIIFNFR